MIYRILVLLVAIAALLGALRWYGSFKYDEGYQARKDEDQAAAELQREANRSTAREAEEKESVRSVYRDRFIVTTVREIRNEAQNLAACVLNDGTIRMLNDAARCAEDSGQASCQSN